MERKQKISTKKIVLTALLAALTVAGSAIRITLPLQVLGTTSFHLGNIMCALSGILLGPWLGGLGAGLGSAIYDMTNPLYISECWITFLTKGAYGLVAGSIAWGGKKTWAYGKATVATVTGAATYALLYLSKSVFYDGMLYSGLPFQAAVLGTMTKLPATVFNAIIAIVCAPGLAMAIRKALDRNRLSLD